MTNAADQTSDGRIDDADGWLAIDADGTVWGAAADSQRATLNAYARKYGDDADPHDGSIECVPAVGEVADAFLYGSAEYGERDVVVDDGVAVGFADAHTIDDGRRTRTDAYRFPSTTACNDAVAAIRGRGDLRVDVRIERCDGGDTIVVESPDPGTAWVAGGVAEFYEGDPIEPGRARSGDARIGPTRTWVEPGDRVAADGRIATLDGIVPDGAVGTVERIAIKGDASGDPVPYLRVAFDDGTTDLIRADAFRPVGRPAY